MNYKNYEIDPASEQMWKQSLNINGCSYQPNDVFEVYDNGVGNPPAIGLPLSAKRLWFFTYCKENNISGRIIPKFDPSQNLLMNSDMKIGDSPFIFITAGAEIYLNDTLVATGYAGQAIPIGNLADLSNAVQSVTGSAQSKALTNAGFGTVDRLAIAKFDGTSHEISATSPLPFTVPETLNNTSEPTQKNEPQDSDTATLFEQLGGDTELAKAKAMPFPNRGHFMGNPIGTLPTKVLELFLKNGNNLSNPSLISTVNAVKMVLEDRESCNGK